MNRNIPLSELIKTLGNLSDMIQSPILYEASMNLKLSDTALICLEHSLFYVRMYKSTDPTGDGEKRRQELIDDSETIIKLIREGGLYP